VNPDAALSKLGIDPAQVSKGVRAEDPFLVATRLAMNGFRVLPTHARNKVPCICEWPERATTDLARLAQWKVRFHSPSWSILTGRENGVWLIDIDGAKGRADLARLESELGPLPITWTSTSGRVGGGEHRWFKPTPNIEDLRTASHVLGCAIDVRGWHGHAVLPGSLHKSGVRYCWADEHAPDECELAELPQAWVDALPKRNATGVATRVRSDKISAVQPRAKIAHDAGSSVLGDGPDGGGFHGPINAIAIRYFSTAGVDASPEKLKESLRKLIAAAPKTIGRSSEEINRYLSDDYLADAIGSACSYVKENNKC
jgi:hypothetical protein